MKIKYKNTTESYYTVLSDLNLISTGKARTFILSIIASIGSFFLTYAFNIGMWSFLIPIVMLVVFYFWFDKVNKNKIRKEIIEILENSHNELNLCDNDLILTSNLEETKLKLEKNIGYTLNNIHDNIVLLKEGRIVFIIPNKTFKTENDKNIFVNAISSKI